ncbi:MAG: hypothetical protein IT426_10265 [Pirellulales bacterium]|nr:hypothetical protein [Pirellulales bacterium]
MNETDLNPRVEPPGDDDQALREYGRQLAMDGLLELALRNRENPSASTPAGKPKATSKKKSLPLRRLSVAAAALAASLLIGVGIWQISQPRAGLPPTQPIAMRNAVPDRSLAAMPPTTLASGWIVEPTGNVEFRVLADDRLRLDRGELRIHRPTKTAAGADPPSLAVETPNGAAVARGTEFYIGAHVAKNLNRNPTQGDSTMIRMTRVLVLAGVVSLSNSLGTIDGGPGALLAAQPNQPPVNLAVQANGQFALDLYRQLSAENAGKNLFFSPYSLSSALAMTAEGARGQTAEEMGKLLGLPSEARRLGDDAQLIPWNTALLHTGMGELNARYNPDRPELKPLRDQIAALRKELDDANRQAALEKNRIKHDELAHKSQQLAGQLNNLYTRVDQYEIRVANALWGEKSFPFRQSYLDTIHKFYNTGGIFSLDFQADPEAARRRINAWVEEQTRDRIRNLIAPGIINSYTRLVLTNAIYFKGEWAAKFEPQATRDEEFQLADGGKKTVPMMRQDHNWSTSYAAFEADGAFFKTPDKYSPSQKDAKLYPEKDGFTMLETPYKGGDLSMVMILPQSLEAMKNLDKTLTGEKLLAWIGKLQPRAVHVAFPKFRLEQEYPLNDTLKAMGMVRAFLDPGLNPNGAQFAGLCAGEDPMHQLYLGAVLHKAFLDVSEKGTEAAAATYEIMPAPMSMAREPDDMEPFIPRFRADKPFAFLIRDKKSGTILFLGRMMNP